MNIPKPRNYPKTMKKGNILIHINPYKNIIYRAWWDAERNFFVVSENGYKREREYYYKNHFMDSKDVIESMLFKASVWTIE